jgi:glycosyltransferase involved in cell wall biosynthesis
MTICSHTIVKNGQPFIDLVLKQVLPFVDRAIVTVSKKSTDGTKKLIEDMAKENPKINIIYEDVYKLEYLTYERQLQVGRTMEDWILFLDDDDYWPTKSLEKLTQYLEMVKDIDGLAFNPFQMVDFENEDESWRYKWFTKVFPNVRGLHYRFPWPKDAIFIDNRWCYWRKNSRVLRCPDMRYFHLCNLKNESFRDTDLFKDSKKFQRALGEPKEVKGYDEDLKKIYEHYKSRNTK